MSLRVLSLFSGIGGFDLSCEWAGMEIVGQVEIDPFCTKVLAKHWPNVKRMEDVKNVKGNEFGQIDLITAGVPCQPSSQAGKRRGKADDRWLWPEATRLLSTISPTWAVFENPTGLLSLERGVVFRGLLSEMENEGYEVWPVIIPACAVGAPHRRDRVWLICYTDHFNENNAGHGTSKIPQLKKAKIFRRKSVADPESREAFPPKPGGLHPKSCSKDSDVANSESKHVPSRRKWSGSIKKEIGKRETVVSRPGYTGKPWTESWPEAATRTCFRGVDDWVSRGMDRTKRLKALGNSIVPQVAYQIMKAIVVANQNNKKRSPG